MELVLYGIVGLWVAFSFIAIGDWLLKAHEQRTNEARWWLDHDKRVRDLEEWAWPDRRDAA